MEMIRTASLAVVRGGRRQNPGSRRRLAVLHGGMSGRVWARAAADAEADAEGRYRNVLVRFSGLRGALTGDHEQT